ncbi:MAG: SsrA-binding protein SmpB [Candidatus Eutrophobiaceae bacterium]
MSHKTSPTTIAQNKRARHDFFIESQLEAGLALQGWEVKSLRAGRVSISESYILLKDGEAYLIGANITPLPSASSHVDAQPARLRKLLLHRREIASLIGAVERKGKAAIPLSLYWKSGKVKLGVAVAQGKKQHDKRKADKEKDWKREQGRLLRR